MNGSLLEALVSCYTSGHIILCDSETVQWYMYIIKAFPFHKKILALIEKLNIAMKDSIRNYIARYIKGNENFHFLKEESNSSGKAQPKMRYGPLLLTVWTTIFT